MSQDTFNKVYTLLLTVYFMAMYSAAWYTGRPVDLVTLAAFLIPGGVHAVHLITQNSILRIEAKKNGGNNATTQGQEQANHQ